MSAHEHVTLITGFPANELATRVLDRLMKLKPDERFVCIVPARLHDQAREWLRHRDPGEVARTELIEGDITLMDLGLSGLEFKDLARRVRVIHHAAAETYSGADRGVLERVNVEGTREVLELAGAAGNLERLVHWSSTAATSTRDGLVMEEDLFEPRRGVLARSRFRAECLVREARAHVPSTVLRPSMLVGDSMTGACARLEGAYLLITGLLSSPRDVPVPLPARADTPLNVVPIDFAVEAGLTLAASAETVSRTLHIVETSPPTLEEALSLFASLVDRPAPRRSVPEPIARALLKLPVLERLTHAHGALVEELGQTAVYDARYAQPILDRAGLHCPKFSSYAPRMAEFVVSQKGNRPSSRPPAAAVPPSG